MLGHKQAADISAGKHQPPCSAEPVHVKHKMHRTWGRHLCTQMLCHQNQNVSFCPVALQSSENCTLMVFLPFFCLSHPSGKAPKLAWAVLQQAVECFYRDLSLGQGSWVLQQWNSLCPWLATPLGKAPHLSSTKANTYNSPKTNTGVTIQFCDYHSQVITTTLC